MKITESMVEEFNRTLKNLNCSFKIHINAREKNPSCEIIPSNDLFIKSSIINVNESFYKVLESYFSDRGIELRYNNTGSIFWSKDGWN